MSKRTGSKSDKGCVGFLYGGVMKQGSVCLFKTSDKEPEERYNELVQYYGNASGRYVRIADVDTIYDKFIEELS